MFEEARVFQTWRQTQHLPPTLSPPRLYVCCQKDRHTKGRTCHVPSVQTRTCIHIYDYVCMYTWFVEAALLETPKRHLSALLLHAMKLLRMWQRASCLLLNEGGSKHVERLPVLCGGFLPGSTTALLPKLYSQTLGRILYYKRNPPTLDSGTPMV